MSIIVEIPSPLRRFTEHRATIEVASADTVREALTCVVERYPPLDRHLFARDGQMFAFVGVFVNGRDIRHLQKDRTPLQGGDTLTLIPAIAGG